MTLIGLMVVLLIAATILIHNGIVSRRNAVRRAWADVLTYQQQKQLVLPKLEQMIASYQEYEGGLLRHVTELRASLGRLGPEPDTAALQDAERASTAVLAGMRVAVEAYPNLQAAGAMREVMSQLVGLQREVTAALSIFSRNVEIYNTGLEVFPRSLVNALVTHAPQVTPFSDKAAAAAFDYRPEV